MALSFQVRHMLSGYGLNGLLMSAWTVERFRMTPGHLNVASITVAVIFQADVRYDVPLPMSQRYRLGKKSLTRCRWRSTG